jgi:hypothetical protein
MAGLETVSGFKYTFTGCRDFRSSHLLKIPGNHKGLPLRTVDWRKTMFAKAASALSAFAVLFILAGNAYPQVTMKKEQTVYVSAYPHVFMGPRGNIFDLAITLVVRNTDIKTPISITSVDYYDTHGKLTKKFLASPARLGPMASTHILITEKDTSGGIGANFIVRWKAEKEVNTPVIEAVMIGGKSGQGISFVISGQEISE